MNPSSVGSIDDKSTWPKSSQDNVPTENNNISDKGEGVKDDENWEHVGEAKNGDISPNELIHQPFLLNSEIIVRDLLLQTGIEVKTFVRFELGEQEP
jgi:translation elongation factor EF-Ts